ncbi:PilN domain-containing protein [Clostridium sp. HBUAS56017]|uniref:PilN domain-containing protein n=1 Tax=Clostridium sp. HBUAS56017 TaxID=2571128 RepID=UPI0011782635|nr:PilN domain-containing protein [Clostridium sp. HBUAS56017]
MRTDLNFFSPYQGIKKEKSDSKKYIYSASGVIGAIIIGSLIWNTVNIYKVQSEIDDYNTKLSDNTLKAKLKESGEITVKTASLNLYDQDFTELATAIKSREVIDTDLLNALSSTLPSEVCFTSIDVQKNKIKIIAEATRRSAIGELEHNLNSLKNVQNVYVSKIVETGVYSCEIECSLKDVE